MIAITCLKKRNAVHIREVPVPQSFVQELQDWMVGAHPVDTSKIHNHKLWAIDRITAWRWVKHVMSEANIHGQQATAKGLRHAFGINAVMSNIPLNVVQKWMGHSDMRTTAIYARVNGPEVLKLAERMW